jgi:hypothetical protein
MAVLMAAPDAGPETKPTEIIETPGGQCIASDAAASRRRDASWI